MEPPPDSSMAGTAARHPSHTPFRFTSITRCQVSGGVSRTPPSSSGKIPALLNSTCEPAVGVDGGGDHGIHLGVVGDIDDRPAWPRPPRPTISSAAVSRRGLRPHVGHHHRGTLRGEQRGGHSTDPAAGSGDDGHLPVESSPPASLSDGPARGGPGVAADAILWSQSEPHADLIGGPGAGGILTTVSTRRSRPLIGRHHLPADHVVVVVGAGSPRSCPAPISTWSRPPAANRCSSRHRAIRTRVRPTRRCGHHRRAGHGFERVVAALDGLVLIGGGDSTPAGTASRPTRHNDGVDPNRDELELGLLQAALGGRPARAGRLPGHAGAQRGLGW